MNVARFFFAAFLALAPLFADAAAAQTPDVREILRRGDQLITSGAHAEAIRLYEETIAALEEHRRSGGSGVEPAAFSVLLNELALLDLAQRDGEAAEGLYRRSLELAEEAFGADHPNVAASLFNLAGTVAEKGRSEEAAVLHRRTLEIWQDALGDGHEQTLLVMEELALLEIDLGRDEEAADLYRRLIEQQANNPHVSVQVRLDNLDAFAKLQRRRGLHAEADALVERIAEVAAGVRLHVLDQADLARRMAKVDLRQGRPTLAELRFQQALDLYALHAPTHPAVDRALEELADLYLQTGSSEEPEARWQKALTKAAEAVARARLRNGVQPPAASPPPPATTHPKPPPEPAAAQEQTAMQEQAAAQEPPPLPTVKPTPLRPAVAPISSGPIYWAQIASRPSRDEAQAETKRCRSLYAAVLEGLPQRFEEADLGERGVWHRIQFGPFDRREARRICRRILEAGHEDCLVVREDP